MKSFKQFIVEKSHENQELDPVGQEDGDVNNDGKEDTGDKVIMARRKAIGKAIADRK
jgi:hypothetical protein